ncbi:sodium p-type [Colletotrichum truncatum]|uniref:Sodium p-type n=1 Tax=Colletotrichum truncatum TaxID=5467 RepID=A0ACC3ZGD0_COLTU|nr:sodium p-type [Colletotrichum truncatum]KAF6784668.1 sodium p-type [Colletotrichum truncatum]
MGKKDPEAEAMANHVSGQSNKPMSRPAHALTTEEVVQELRANTDDGLTPEEAKARLDEYGRNEFGADKGVQPLKIFIGQIANAMTLVLILAMGASFGIESWIEGAVVAGVITLNITVGFHQEFKAAKTMDSLRSLSSPTAQAVREGRNVTVPTVEIVPGDMVELKTGDTIPADVRIVEAVNFETNEALLTGESLPIRKEAAQTFDDETGPGDRLNVAYSSSTVTKGRARGIVFATGMYTEIGQIAAALRGKNSRRRDVKRKEDGSASFGRYLQAWTLTLSDAVGRFLGVNVGTPLQKKLSKLAILLFGTAVVCAMIVLGANNFNTTQEVVIYAVATGLAMIPASLVVVLTITMAAGTKRMVQRHVIVRQLRSLEALGGVTNICSDKTGTLTQGKMVVRKAWVPGKGTFSVSNTKEPFNPTVGDLGLQPAQPKDIDFRSQDAEGEAISKPEDMILESRVLTDYFNIASLANLANVHKTPEGEWHARGDPTEIAIQVFASRFNWNRLRFSGDNSRWRQLAEFPFDSDVKKMSVIFQDTEAESGKNWLFTKGAVERVISSCPQIQMGDEVVELTKEIEKDILSNMEALARLGLRVLAFASKSDIGTVDNHENLDRMNYEKDLTFRGLIGLYDPPRPESAPSVHQFHQAGVMVHMLTGDHPETARAIALEVGILPTRMNEISSEVAKTMVMAAHDFDKLTDDEIDKLPRLPLVVARCAPQTKVRMIEALHRRGCFVAMTGDGVNDSPSLKRADVGIAMGESGSDVAKEASDIILTDDNFASILNAVEEGRRMFDNIQKFVLHVLACNVAQACTLLIGLAFKDDSGLSVFPLAPVEVMWIIMITSGLPDMALGFEVAAPDIMDRPPQNMKVGVFTWELMLDMLVYGLWTAALCLASFILVMFGWGNGDFGENCNNSYSERCDTVFRARATCFASLTWFALFLAWEMVNMRRSFFRMQPKSKKYFTQWFWDTWRNKLLFFAIIVGFVTIFPLTYIPVLNTSVFKHAPITWEWGIVFVCAILFFAGVEAWKWAKRIYFRRQAHKQHGGNPDLESRVFGHYYTIGGVELESSPTLGSRTVTNEKDMREKGGNGYSSGGSR